MKTNDQNSIFRQIPKVDQFIARPAAADWIQRTGREFVVAEIQRLLNEVRDGIRGNPAGAAGAVNANAWICFYPKGCKTCWFRACAP